MTYFLLLFNCTLFEEHKSNCSLFMAFICSFSQMDSLHFLLNDLWAACCGTFSCVIFMFLQFLFVHPEHSSTPKLLFSVLEHDNYYNLDSTSKDDFSTNNDFICTFVSLLHLFSLPLTDTSSSQEVSLLKFEVLWCNFEMPPRCALKAQTHTGWML